MGLTIFESEVSDPIPFEFVRTLKIARFLSYWSYGDFNTLTGDGSGGPDSSKLRMFGWEILSLIFFNFLISAECLDYAPGISNLEIVPAITDYRCFIFLMVPVIIDFLPGFFPDELSIVDPKFNGSGLTDPLCPPPPLFPNLDLRLLGVSIIDMTYLGSGLG